jgi:peptide/nickel transport system permease protein
LGDVFRRLSRDKVSVVCASYHPADRARGDPRAYLGLANPYTGSMIRRLRWIGTPGYPLGTDELGRDMVARLIYGGGSRCSSVSRRWCSPS